MKTGKKIMIEWIDTGLARWADYFRDGRDNGLGYPSCSVEAREMMGGGQVTSSGDVPELIAFMETVVLSMDEEMQTVVKVAYMSSDNRHDQAQRLSHKLKRKISRPHMVDLLNRAHQYIDGYSKGYQDGLKKC